jgi:hypothetical protein
MLRSAATKFAVAPDVMHAGARTQGLQPRKAPPAFRIAHQYSTHATARRRAPRPHEPARRRLSRAGSRAPSRGRGRPRSRGSAAPGRARRPAAAREDRPRRGRGPSRARAPSPRTPASRARPTYRGPRVSVSGGERSASVGRTTTCARRARPRARRRPRAGRPG